MGAAYRAQGGAVRRLLAAGARVNVQGRQGETALLIAQRHYLARKPGFQKIIRLLKHHGATGSQGMSRE